jgi:hypothetical protein
MDAKEGVFVIGSFLLCSLDKHGILGDKLREQIPHRLQRTSSLIDKKRCPEYTTGDEKIIRGLDP